MSTDFIARFLAVAFMFLVPSAALVALLLGATFLAKLLAVIFAIFWLFIYLVYKLSK